MVQPRTRAQRRSDTEARILNTAREQFAELGYERATIRRIASGAHVDPGLVIHYYGSKQRLFTRAAAHAPEQLAGDTPAHIADSILATVRQRLTEEPVASLVILRSMLTHDPAADTYRIATATRLEQIAATIPAPDAVLRASLISAIIQGVIVQRWLLGDSFLADATPANIVEVLRPCFRALLTPSPTTPLAP